MRTSNPELCFEIFFKMSAREVFVNSSRFFKQKFRSFKQSETHVGIKLYCLLFLSSKHSSNLYNAIFILGVSESLHTFLQ